MSENEKRVERCTKTYSVKIGENSYRVEVGDLRERPIIASVDGTVFEIWPENQNGINPVDRPAVQEPARPAVQAVTARPVPGPSGAAAVKSQGGKQVLAPIPGTVLSILVQSGDEVAPGQELFVLEAMKMKNNIRATRGGVVEKVFVTPNQIVNHHDILLEFTE